MPFDHFLFYHTLAAFALLILSSALGFICGAKKVRGAYMLAISLFLGGASLAIFEGTLTALQPMTPLNIHYSLQASTPFWCLFLVACFWCFTTVGKVRNSMV